MQIIPKNVKAFLEIQTSTYIFPYIAPVRSCEYTHMNNWEHSNSLYWIATLTAAFFVSCLRLPPKFNYLDLDLPILLEPFYMRIDVLVSGSSSLDLLSWHELRPSQHIIERSHTHRSEPTCPAMSREAYTVPTSTEGSSSPGRKSPSNHSPSRQAELAKSQQPAYERLPTQNPRITYQCAECGSRVQNRRGERLQCDFCGGVLFHKMKTKAMCQFDARWDWYGATVRAVIVHGSGKNGWHYSFVLSSIWDFNLLHSNRWVDC